MTAEVVVLTGPDCVSACDDFTAVMKDSGVARIAGMPPAAGDSPVRVRVPLELADGTSFGVVLTVAVNRRPNGAVLEGAPDMPSVPVFPSAANRGRYLDTVLGAVGF